MSKEYAYAYEAGYRDGSIHYELEHCPACKNVADLQEALDENARLRSELESVGTAAYLYGRSDLNADNAKLREQIASFRELSQDMVIFAGTIMARHFAGRLRELGVEVNE